MNIKRSVSFYLQKVYNETNNGESQIRMRVRWEGNIAQFNCGYTVRADKWDRENSRCKKNNFNSKGYSSMEINRELNRLENIAQGVFKSFEVIESVPKRQQYKAAFNEANGKDVGIDKSRAVVDYIREFVSEQSSVNSWTDGTVFKFNTLMRRLEEIKPGLSMDDLNSSFYIKFIDHILNHVGVRNNSALKSWKIFQWFLRWAGRKGYLRNSDHVDFNPRLRTVSDKEVVYLTWDELMRVYTLSFPEGKKYLERVRDVFCFQCFTSLRYSDVAKLRREDIDGDVIRVVTKKTGDTVRIELNKYSRSILEKYKDDDRPLPVISNQRMNVWLKEVCFLAGIDTPVVSVYYKGAERFEEVRPKYELIGTHTGRRTFICNALTMGIPAATVMEWTGHSDYKAMKTYVRIADKEKAKAMRKFDER